MKLEEEVTEQYLQISFPGKQIAHEPDESVPPDFFVDHKFAIDVRRLKENIIEDEQ